MQDRCVVAPTKSVSDLWQAVGSELFRQRHCNLHGSSRTRERSLECRSDTRIL
jgi:hypothetical protein